MKLQFVVFLVAMVLVVLPFSKTALGTSVAPERSDLDNLRNRIYKDWAPSKKLAEEDSVYITISGNAEGKLYDVEIEKSSGDRQLDADCLQAVMGTSCSCRLDICPEDLDHFTCKFDSKTPIGHKEDAISKYFSKHPKKKNDYIAFYRIPLDVLKRYPGLFLKSELLEESNIGLIKAISPEDPELPFWVKQQLKILYQRTWVPFFLSHPKPTKQQIIDLRNKLPFDEKSSFVKPKEN